MATRDLLDGALFAMTEQADSLAVQLRLFDDVREALIALNADPDAYASELRALAIQAYRSRIDSNVARSLMGAPRQQMRDLSKSARSWLAAVSALAFTAVAHRQPELAAALRVFTGADRHSFTSLRASVTGAVGVLTDYAAVALTSGTAAALNGAVPLNGGNAVTLNGGNAVTLNGGNAFALPGMTALGATGATLQAEMDTTAATFARLDADFHAAVDVAEAHRTALLRGLRELRRTWRLARAWRQGALSKPDLRIVIISGANAKRRPGGATRVASETTTIAPTSATHREGAPSADDSAPLRRDPPTIDTPTPLSAEAARSGATFDTPTPRFAEAARSAATVDTATPGSAEADSSAATVDTATPGSAEAARSAATAAFDHAARLATDGAPAHRRPISAATAAPDTAVAAHDRGPVEADDARCERDHPAVHPSASGAKTARGTAVATLNEPDRARVDDVRPSDASAAPALAVSSPFTTPPAELAPAGAGAVATLLSESWPVQPTHALPPHAGPTHASSLAASTLASAVSPIPAHDPADRAQPPNTRKWTRPWYMSFQLSSRATAPRSTKDSPGSDGDA
jgi:hypothetical protein